MALLLVAAQVRGARKIAAEGVDRHRIRLIQSANEIGDRVFGVDEAAVHEVAGVEENEDVGADEGIRRQWLGIPTCTTASKSPAASSGFSMPPVAYFHRGPVAFRERRKLLQNPVLR